MECSICLNTLRRTRHSHTLDCGHVFHTHCFLKWKESGGDTCPLCRDYLKKPLFRITVNIENCETGASTQRVSERRVGMLSDLESADISFEIENVSELTEIVEGGLFGLTLSDFDTSILHTEG